MASSTERGVQLKSPVALPPCIPAPPVIEFLHPHYSGPDALFRLPKLDLTPSVSGVHYRTALLACQIVANNAFDGYLATDRDGEARVVADDDDLLTGNKYWFIADANNPHDNYPIVPRFEDWIFPHEEFQGLRWRCPKDSDQDQVQPQTRRCIISNVSCLIRSSHIIPPALEAWFTRNYMERFGADILSIHSPSNRIDLRHDLHHAWDRHMFVLTPKQSELTLHVLNCSASHGTCEFAAQWHNVPVRKAALQNVADEYLFAKFAQAIFTLLKPCITRGFSRQIARLKASADGDWEQSVDKLTGDMLRENTAAAVPSEAPAQAVAENDRTPR